MRTRIRQSGLTSLRSRSCRGRRRKKNRRNVELRRAESAIVDRIGSLVMVISSRTPEGSPNRCPVCGKDLRLEPSSPFGDAPCPHCGHLLWFVALSADEQRFYDREAGEGIRPMLLESVARSLGISKEELEADPSLLRNQRIDSLDLLEVIMDTEEEFGKG